LGVFVVVFAFAGALAGAGFKLAASAFRRFASANKPLASASIRVA
jgi:hypothetical protein